ncbi:protein ANTI-SILENCING 1 [Trifolium pratense]|uniref:protein ANTI-SILENCING 1 n=1 Tax=Trifolium pratense TaxID=57577 RepID=UPI001E6942F9|nr:protein ANTI-SILENCING 1 [Trifolium pratense]XP_045806728.1 protein ANTI-SILENCING 1 [Trifolium pratense]
MPPLHQQQQPCCEEEIVRDGNFKWGNKRGIGVKNKDTQFYDSFVLHGVEYFLYDCVYFYHTNHVETSIGKLVKMYQTSTQKMIKVVWFFRPSEIRNFFGSYKPGWNELFLASGKDTGVTNRNSVDSIIGKCNVVCTSEDKRNPKPSETELKRADFVFKCTFDVDRLVINDKFPDKIDGIEVEKFFNKKVDKKTSNNLHLETNNPSKSIKIKIKKRTSENVEDKDEVRDEVKAETAPSDVLRCKVKDEVRISENVLPKINIRTSENFKDEVKTKDEVRISENVSPKRSLDSHSFKKRKIIEENSIIGQSSDIQKKEDFDEKEELRQDKSVKLNRKVIEVTERPNSEKRKWFKKMPWKERLQKAQESDTLVLLSNLDPSYTSYEVEDLVWHVLKEKAEARMIESSPTSNTYYGRALVIFRTKEAAENAISELNRRCLILEGGRVVIAKKGTVTDPAKKNTLTGHLSINRGPRHKQSREMRNAVSTSHCSQPNTIEYAMAMEWTKQYYKSEACWKALCEKQMKEIDDVKSKLRSVNIF